MQTDDSILYVNKKITGRGKAVIVAVGACVAVLSLASCTTESPSTARDEQDRIENEMQARGFTSPSLLRDNVQTGSIVYTVDAGSCRGTLVVDNDGIHATFSDEKGRKVSMDNPSVPALLAQDRLQYCEVKKPSE